MSKIDFLSLFIVKLKQKHQLFVLTSRSTDVDYIDYTNN